MALPDLREDRASRYRSLFADEVAFRRWYDDALPQVYSFVLARCGGVTADALDVTQETFVDAVRYRDRYDGRAEPITWLCSIARNKIADGFRRRSREERRRLALVAEDGGQTDPEPGLVIESREDVLAALRSIPSSQSTVLALHYLDELPVREIARTLGRSESAIESLLARGRESFRRVYATPEVIR